ncbi:MAG: ATP-dependent DNA helicase RecG [Hyphomicrobiales bacterium]
MRPDQLNAWFASARGLKGIGPNLERALGVLFGRESVRLADLVFHLPSGVIDRRLRPPIADLPREGIVTVEVTVGRHKPSPRGAARIPYRVDVFDDTGTLTLTWFHANADYLKRLLPEGETRFISGRIEWYGGQPQIVHPDHVVSAEDFAKLPLVEPVYPLTAGISGKVLGKAIRAALEKLTPLPEWQDAAFVKARGFPPLIDALKALHDPKTPSDLAPQAPARLRLAYDELLANQLALALLRRQMRLSGGRAVKGDGRLRRAILDALPYSLTGSQVQALADISADLERPQKMIRLLQGDVGSGKTVVALLALAQCVEAGAQGALMAPTDILARQHFRTLEPLAARAGIRIDLVTGREKGAAREVVLERLRSGETQIAVGTHAMFQEGVAFHDLALAVIDEQHRFGVHQRLALQAKAGAGANLLVMTATPIPRTLSLTLYGDLDVSRLTEKPAGRKPVDTRTVPLERLGEVVDGLARAIAQGQRAYWVCPLVEESEAVDKAAAEQRYAALKERFGGSVGLVHGRMKGPEKDAVMAAFKEGALKILVSTTVIEVGVDVPEATIMIVENAERFGLAQLHQLRGRVGRGGEKSSCVLLYDGPLGETARARLAIMRETEDGFLVAEEDLRLRGSGEVLGTRQSGMATFRLADVVEHGELLAAARDDVTMLLDQDAELASMRAQSLRLLLHLFERNEAVRLIEAG